MKKNKRETDNKTVKHQEFKRKLKCPVCPPNRGENSKRKPKHGTKKPKAKTQKKNVHICPAPFCPACDFWD